jgi:transient receptor potential cation channel subfamily A protein 1
LCWNASQWTPLHCAASGGFDELVSLLIGAEADVDPSDPKVTPLLLAARFGHVKVVQLLFNAKANVTHTDKNGSNALDLAIDNGHEAVAMAIVNSEKWDEALRNTTGDTKTEGNNTCCTKRGGNTTTPLRKLIRKMPEVAKVVLNKCIVTKNEGEVSIM